MLISIGTGPFSDGGKGGPSRYTPSHVLHNLLWNASPWKCLRINGYDNQQDRSLHNWKTRQHQHCDQSQQK